jgi:hypothetical protein
MKLIAQLDLRPSFAGSPYSALVTPGVAQG